VRLILIRHAESQGNVENRFQGQLDYPLSDRGVEQARRLAARLLDRHLDHIYTSPLLRANHTAEIVAEAKGMTVSPLPGVIEYHFGELSGLSWAEIEERHPELAAAQRTRGRAYAPWPGEEGRDAFRERVCAALWALEADHAEETIAVVSHGGAIAVFCQSVLGLDHAHRPPFMVENTALFEIEVRNGRGTIWTANDTCHLAGE
jgi:broad specificity phosphatase PhoE